MLVFLGAIAALIRACSARHLHLDWKPPFDTYETYDPGLGRLRRPYLTSEPDASVCEDARMAPRERVVGERGVEVVSCWAQAGRQRVAVLVEHE